MILRKRIDKKDWVDKTTENAGGFQKHCKSRRQETYSTMSETQALFDEVIMRSLINILCRYMEVYG